MVNMYGFKYRDLLCIRNNPNGAERVSNWDTILRYHILQTWLGPSHCTDVRETLIYAFKHLEDLRKQARARYQTRAHQLLAAPLRSAAYFRLEMDVAAQMIARLWEDARTHDSRTIPSVRRKKFSAVGSPRRGQWDDLPPALQWALLGWPLRTDLAEKYARFVKLPFPAATGLGAGGIGGEGSESSARGGEGGEGGGRSDWVKQAAKAVLGEFTALVL
ncbi:hypothetical protein F4809DRAFT_620097 [Biscogniauxia mediterranea]|nr:hypothetical protein F4809DRAFT_620097 [Biscogniauxia mediterranea]